MPIQPLPSKPHIDRLKGTAKDLRDLVRAGVAGAIETVREHHPRFRSLLAGSPEATTFKLSDAQLTLARHHGFSSWPKLAQCVDLMRPLSRSPHETIGEGTGKDADELIRLACLNYGEDSPNRVTAAIDVWHSRRALESVSVFSAAAVGDHDAVARFVADDPRQPVVPAGPSIGHRCCTRHSHVL